MLWPCDIQSSEDPPESMACILATDAGNKIVDWSHCFEEQVGHVPVMFLKYLSKISMQPVGVISKSFIGHTI